jgi:hypothetical protein
MGMAVQLISGYVTLPLYALVTQVQTYPFPTLTGILKSNKMTGLLYYNVQHLYSQKSY